MDSSTSNDHSSPDKVKRKCTDVFWLLLFILFWVGMAFIAWQAIITGDPRILLYPKDSEGLLCGRNNIKAGKDYTKLPNLYFFNPFDKSAPQVCVDKCPSETTVLLPDDFEKTVCKYNAKPTSASDFVSMLSDKNCTDKLYKSEPILNRCAPVNISSLIELIPDGKTKDIIADTQDLAQKIVGDFARTWWFFLAFAGGAMIFSFVWVILLKYVAGFFVWFIIFLSLISIDGLAVFFYFAWDDAKKALAANADGYQTEGMKNEERTYFGMFITACVVAGLLNIIVLVAVKRIKVAIQVIKEASKAVKALPFMIFFPLIGFLLMLVVFSYWVIIELYLASADIDGNLFGFKYQPEYLKYFQWYHLFGLFWTQQLLSGINQATLAGAVSQWYWTRDKRSITGMPTLRSFGRIIRYHLGSIALGSLLIAIIQIIRVILFQIERTLKKKENKFTKTALACCQCCFACVEKVFKFINKNAYIEMAVNGTPFCKSAKNAFQLLLRNAFRLVAISGVSGFILFLSKVAVSCMCGVGSYYAMEFYFANNKLYYTSASVFVIMVLSYVVTSVFMYVYSMAVDTIFLSFCEDCEKNDGSSARPYFMSQELQQITNLKASMIEKNQVRPGSGEKIVQTRQAFVEDV